MDYSEMLKQLTNLQLDHKNLQLQVEFFQRKHLDSSNQD